MIPARKVRFLTELLKKKGKVDEAYLKKVYDTIYYECNMCRRCSLYCPFGIDIALMISTLRSLLHSQGMAPEGLLRAIENYQATGNQMAVTEEEWVEHHPVEEETAEEIIGIEHPHQQKRRPDHVHRQCTGGQVLSPWTSSTRLKIFHVAREDWTLPSKADGTTPIWPCFAGDTKTARIS